MESSVLCLLPIAPLVAAPVIVAPVFVACIVIVVVNGDVTHLWVLGGGGLL